MRGGRHESHVDDRYKRGLLKTMLDRAFRLSRIKNGSRSVILPFKDQSSAGIVRAQLKDLTQTIEATVLAIFVNHKIKQHLKPLEVRSSIVNQQSLVYQFKCDLCDPSYVGCTRRHLHQRVDEHKNASSSIRKHFRFEHSYVPNDLTRNFTILKKCKSKFDCLIYEMFLINELRPSLNVQSDSIRAKVF